MTACTAARYRACYSPQELLTSSVHYHPAANILMLLLFHSVLDRLDLPSAAQRAQSDVSNRLVLLMPSQGEETTTGNSC